MPKEFGAWVAEMAGTIEDKSTFVSFTSGKDVELTNLQKRVLIADVLVSDVDTEDDVYDWVSAFCVIMSHATRGTKIVTNAYLADIVGREVTRGYMDSEGDEESLEWLRGFKQSINNRSIV